MTGLPRNGATAQQRAHRRASRLVEGIARRGALFGVDFECTRQQQASRHDNCNQEDATGGRLDTPS
ncbi:hypothetical protein ACMTN4_01570 (plasmid) [Rhodococcus globerulus]|uniref:hypothetical protein n=1 Tax=Rhodococcus globerulus TaxID=33008 RepID=UPI0039EBC206